MVGSNVASMPNLTFLKSVIFWSVAEAMCWGSVGCGGYVLGVGGKRNGNSAQFQLKYQTGAELGKKRISLALQ